MVEKANKRLKIRLLFLLTAALVFLYSHYSFAISFITDDEAETLLHNIAKPIFKTANITFNPNNFYLVNDNTLNAFVGDGNRLFINTGTILAADKVNEIYGVIAHEAGHIKGGHILRLKLKNQSMHEIGLVSTIVAGTAILATGRPDVGMAVLLGSHNSILNNYSIYKIGEERSADQAANEILKANKISTDGMLNFMKKIKHQNQLNGREEIPYFRTHPVTNERISFFENVSNKNNVASSHFEEDFLRVKAKLYAFLNSPKATFQKYPRYSDNSIAAKYARVIANFKQLNMEKAQKGINELIAIEPNNPYFHELKGQIYLETGKIKHAIDEYKKALYFKPDSPLLQIALAQAMLENSPSQLDLQEIISLLKKAQIKRPSTTGLLLLSRAYAAKNEEAKALFYAAEFSFVIGEYDTASKQLSLVRKKANNNKSLLLKAEDLSAKISEKLNNE